MRERIWNLLAVISVALLAIGVVMLAAYHPIAVGAQVLSVPPLQAFTPTGQATIAMTTTTANVALPTTAASTPAATTVIVTNESASAIAYVVLGTANTVAATVTTGFPLAPNTRAVLTIRNNTYIAAIGSATGSVGISTGY
jgi:hypothetical protein